MDENRFMRIMAGIIVAVVVVFVLTGCQVFSEESRQEMRQTGEVPQSIRNEAKAWMSIYCDGPIIGNVNMILTNIAQGLYPPWKSSCQEWAQQQ